MSDFEGAKLRKKTETQLSFFLDSEDTEKEGSSLWDLVASSHVIPALA